MDQVEQGQIAKLTAERTIPEFGPAIAGVSLKGGTRAPRERHPGYEACASGAANAGS